MYSMEAVCQYGEDSDDSGDSWRSASGSAFSELLEETFDEPLSQTLVIPRVELLNGKMASPRNLDQSGSLQKAVA